MAEVPVKVDDIDGSPADVTLRFAIGGKTYEMDLSAANAARFTDTMTPWITAARPASGSRRRQRTRSDRERAGAIRAWAIATGRAVADRGRLPAGIIAEYDNRISR